MMMHTLTEPVCPLNSINYITLHSSRYPARSLSNDTIDLNKSNPA